MKRPLVGAWDQDPLWARFYPLTVEHPAPTSTTWRPTSRRRCSRARWTSPDSRAWRARSPRPSRTGELPFEDGSFDLVVSLTGLRVFPDPHRAIGEMVRVLKPGAGAVRLEVSGGMGHFRAITQ